MPKREHNDVIMVGGLWMQKVSVLPTWTSDETGRFFYLETSGVVYYADDIGYKEMGSNSASTPTGTVLSYAGSSAPTGYLLCDGTEYETTGIYASLYAVIGTTYNTGGETGFRVPDMTGRVAVGAGAGAGLTSRALADQGGEENHKLTESEMPSHTHTAEDQTSSALSGIGPASQGYRSPGTTGLTGGDVAHNTMQPYTALNSIIKL